MHLREAVHIYREFYSNCIAPHKKWIILDALLAGIACLLEFGTLGMVLPLLSQFTSNQTIALPAFLPHLSQNQCIGICILAITLLTVIKNGFLILYQYYVTRLAIRIENTITIDILEKMSQGSYRLFLVHNSDVWLQHFKNTIGTCSMCLPQLFQFFIYSGLLVILIGFMLWKLFWITLLSVIAFGVYGFLLNTMNKKIVCNAQTQLVPLQIRAIGMIQNVLGSQQELRIAHTISNAIEPIKPIARTVHAIGHFLDYIRVVESNFLEIWVGLIFALLAGFSLKIYGSAQTLIYLGAWIVCAARFVPFINRIMSAYYTFWPQIASIQSLNQVYRDLKTYALTDVSPDAQHAFEHSIVLKNVTFAYRDNVPVLQGIDLTIEAGDFIGIVGKSGAGKTTLVSTILGLLPPTQGTYQMDGVPITQWNQIKPCFGYVSQNPCIITGTIAENIAFGSAVLPERIRQAMEEAQLHEFTPDTLLDEMGKNISGGQRQRIAIARALYRQARLLVLDEITSSLDAITEQKIMDAINRLKGRCTIIAIAHRLGTLKQCNRILYMEAGRIKAEGNFEHLYQQSADFKQIVDTLQQANNTKTVA